MKKIVCLTILFFCIHSLHAQRETDNWYFGDKAGLNFFNPDPTVLNNGQMVAPAGCASISDNQGNLLFYTNGETIWNSSHQIMENGDNIAGEPENNQNSIIIPRPGSNTLFYIFNTRSTTTNSPVLLNSLYYSIVEISASFPLGRVITKNIRLNYTSSEKLTAVHHRNGKDIWLISLGATGFNDTNDNSFYAYKITENGLQVSTVVISSIDAIDPVDGVMKVSPDGNTLVAAFGTKLFKYDFNNENGNITLENPINLEINFSSGYVAYGVSFSPDSKILYYSTYFYNGNSRTYNLLQVKLDDIDPFFFGNSIFSDPNLLPGDIQLANNGKIYVTFYTSQNGIIQPLDKIGVINNPNELEGISEYRHQSLNISPAANFLGLPNFIQSYFRNRIVTENKCVTDIFDFSLDAYLPITSANWDFGDGNTSNNLSPSHIYTTPGKYTVTANVVINGNIIAFYKEIEVYPLPNLTSNQNLVQCDINNDGVDFFDLFDIREKITIPNLNEELVFYRNRIDAENNENSISNPEQFQNESNPQEIHVRVISDKSCFSLTSFEIESRFVQLDTIDDIFECDNSDNTNGDGNALFDLRVKRGDIINQLNLTANAQVRFYDNLIDAQITNNELDLAFISPSTTIYTRIDTNLDCGGIAPFNLIVNQTPVINLNDNYILCIDPVTNPPLVLDGNNSNNRFEWRNSLGNIVSIGREFTLAETGDYSLTVYKIENGIECSNYKEFTVRNPDPPVFQNISVNTESDINSVNVSVSGNSNYQFSLDNVNFFGFGLNHTFTNVEPGVKTIYVRDVNNCEAEIQTNVSVINFPNFFTPNFDRRNDQWIVKGLSDQFFNSIKIEIFDRHGKFLHLIDSTNFEEGWNGNFKENRMPPTNYWYKALLIDINGKEIIKTGSIALIR